MFFYDNIKISEFILNQYAVVKLELSEDISDT